MNTTILTPGEVRAYIVLLVIVGAVGSVYGPLAWFVSLTVSGWAFAIVVHYRKWFEDAAKERAEKDMFWAQYARDASLASRERRLSLVREDAR